MTIHVPILVKPILEALVEPFAQFATSSEPYWLVDCTLGGGGHTSVFLKRPEFQKHRILALDQDAEAIARAQERFKKEIQEGRLELQHLRFGSASDVIRDRPVLGVLADLGFSSDQLEASDRGLSFQTDAPLDMRLDPNRGISCYELLRQVSETELETILSELGEERFARRIASSIISRRRAKQLPKTTRELVEIVVKAIPVSARHGRIHVATRTFQALRIAVNEELLELDRLLEEVIPQVRVGGRVAIISFHSLEDRKVKQCFKRKELFKSLTKKPMQADDEELQMNPRARSAKLRIAERVDEHDS